MDRELLSFPMHVAPGQQGLSGPQRLYPFVDAAVASPASGRPSTVLVLCHPSGNFLNHYLMEPLTSLGYAVCGVNTRYAGNDAFLIMEEALLDIGAAVSDLRRRFEHVVLVGNSGGGSIMATYQSQAEKPTITSTPAGESIDLEAAALGPADAFVAVAAHPGRARVLAEALDPSVVDESDPYRANPELDMFEPWNGPPYDSRWIARYRRAQLERNDAITDRVQEELADVRKRGFRDRAFITYRTSADPRFLDLSLEPSDRQIGCLYGDARAANYGAAGGMARVASLRSWLSQWSVRTTQTDGIEALSSVERPVLVVSFNADQGVFPSHARLYFDAVQHEDKRYVEIPGATHYLHKQPQQTEETAEAIAGWLEDRGFPRA